MSIVGDHGSDWVAGASIKLDSGFVRITDTNSPKLTDTLTKEVFKAIVLDNLKYKEVAEQLKELMIQSVVEAGKFFNFNIPLEADAKIGVSWAEIH